MAIRQTENRTQKVNQTKNEKVHNRLLNQYKIEMIKDITIQKKKISYK